MVKMEIRCKQCGAIVVVNGSGRPALSIPVTKVCDTIRHYGSVAETAAVLHCSRAYIYKVLKGAGRVAAEIANGRK